MKKFSGTALLLCSLLLGTAAHAESDAKKELSDIWLESKLVTTYALNEHLNPFKLHVEVDDGIAYLSGTVDNSAEQDLAIEIAKGVEGIREVRHSIEVAPSEKPAEKQRSQFSQDVADATLTARVKTKLLWNRHTNGLDIDVDTRRGVVALRGTVDSEITRDLAVQLAKNTRGVERVENRLEVRDKEEIPLVETTEKALNDGWITAKVKTMLLFSKEAEGAEVSVHTDDQVVTLIGRVKTRAQEERIKKLVEDVVGVREVRSELLLESE